MTNNVGLEDFKDLFGMNDISPLFEKTYNQLNFKFKYFEEDELEKLITKSELAILNDKQIVGDPSRRQVWQHGWEEPLYEFIGTKSLESLIPKFIRNNEVKRYRSRFIKSEDPCFELNVVTLLQTYLIEEYLSKYKHIYDFGVGSGFNAAEICQLLPNATVLGLDFVESSVQLMKELRKHTGFNIDGNLFDLVNPDFKFKLHHNSAVFTMGTIEQIPGKFKLFITYLLLNNPGICVHVEPTVELYNLDNRIDILAAKFHLKRGYTTGFLPFLQELEAAGYIEILKIKRTTFGTKSFEGYTILVWKPI